MRALRTLSTLGQMLTTRRMFYASLASAAAFFVVPAISSYISMQTPYLSPHGSPDNAPARVIGILVLIASLLFVLVASLAFGGAVLLRRLGQLKPTVLTAIVIVAGLSPALFMVLDRPFGWADMAYYFAGFAALILATFGLSALVWWKVACHGELVEP